MGRISTEIASTDQSESVDTVFLSMTLDNYEVEEVTVVEAEKLMGVTAHNHSVMLETSAREDEYLRL